MAYLFSSMDQPRFRALIGFTLPRALFGISTVAALLVLAGWHWDISAFKSVLPGFISMKANTALGLFLLSLAGLLSVSDGLGGLRLPLRNLLALGVFLLGSATLAEYLFAVDFKIDELLFA
ncbi:MAG: hypothetical protein EOP11_23950, partial [Proteobacteria bacterium]